MRLIQRGHAYIHADLHLAAVGLQPAGEEIEKRRLAGAIGTDHADTVAAQYARGEVRYDLFLTIGFGNLPRLDDPRAALFGLGCNKGYIARDAQLFAAPLPQLPQPRHAADIAFAPPAHAITYPILFHRDSAVELVTFDLFLGQHLVAPRFEIAEAAFKPPRSPAVEPHRDARQIFQKPPVVTDQDQRAAQSRQFLFEPFDRRKIEMVGGLVEQENIGRGRKGSRECGAPRLSTR